MYIDDAEYPLGRANYVLRAAVIPSGRHEVRMVFDPQAIHTDTWSLIFVILSLLLSIGLIAWGAYVGLKKHA